MKIFYQVSEKQLLKDRNELFKKVGIPGLAKNNFQSAQGLRFSRDPEH